MSSPAAIDPRIQRLKLTTFFGKRLTRRQIADVQEMAASLPGLSRNELGKTVCEHLGWKTKRGRSRVRLAVRVLEELERLGVLSLPEKRRRRRGGDKPVTVTARSAPRPLICATSCATGRGGCWDAPSSSTRRASWPAGTSGSAGRAKRSTGT